jgi:hypothetical protein
MYPPFCIFAHIVAGMALDHIVATVAMDAIVACYSFGCPSDIIAHDVAQRIPLEF